MSDAADALAHLRALVAEDAGLEQQLLRLVDRDQFLAAVVLAAQSNGLELTPEDLTDAMNDARRQWVERWL